MSNTNNFSTNKFPVKFFAIDIDKTFYVDDKEVFDRNKRSWKELSSKGILPFLCTSRCYCSAMVRLGDDFENDTEYKGFPGVYANGCCVFDEKGNTLLLKTFSKEFLDKYVKYMKENKIEDNTIFETVYTSLILTEPSKKINKNVEKRNMHKPELSRLREIYEKDIVCVRHIQNGIAIPDLEEGRDYVCNIYGNVVTLNPPGVTKVIGIKILLEHYNSDESECAYIGDSINDREAMEFCKTSFAVGNADDETKRKAKWVLDLNYDQGAFSKAVEFLCDD